MEPKIQTVNYNLNESEKKFNSQKTRKIWYSYQKTCRKFKNYNKKEHELLEFDAHVHFNWGKIIHIREDDKVFLNLIDRAIENFTNSN